jgi:hypothetical protein
VGDHVGIPGVVLLHLPPSLPSFLQLATSQQRFQLQIFAALRDTYYQIALQHFLLGYLHSSLHEKKKTKLNKTKQNKAKQINP